MPFMSLIGPRSCYRGSRSVRACLVASGGIIAVMTAFPPVATAQTGIFSIFQKKTEEAPSPYADAQDDHAAWVATGAPLMIRPSPDIVARAPRPVDLPVPPRRPGTEASAQTQGVPVDVPAIEPPPVNTPPGPPVDEPHPAGEAPPSRQYASLPQESFRPSLPTLASPGAPEKVTPEEIEREEQSTPEPSDVEKQTDYVNIQCLKPELMAIMQKAGKHFGGTPVITSGQRDRGRRGSYHRRCMAADFFIAGVERTKLASYLRRLPEAGGVGTYCHTKSVHIDIGDPRNWWQCGRRFRFSQRS